MLKRRSGFTLVEFLIVIATIGVMLLIFVKACNIKVQPQEEENLCVFTIDDKLSWHMVKINHEGCARPTSFRLENGSEIILREWHVFSSKECPFQDVHKRKGE